MKQHPEIDEKFLAKQKRKLLAEKARLEKDLAKVAVKKARGYQPKWTAVGDDEDENAQESDLFLGTAQLEGNFESLLQNTNSALKRIEEGTYGFDITDGSAISRERLDAFPAATMTKANEDKLEKSLKRFIKGRGFHL